MKKVFFSLAIAGFFGLASCSSEKDCRCASFMNGEEVEGSAVTQTIDFSDVDDASDCDDLNESVSQGGMTVEVKCEEV